MIKRGVFLDVYAGRYKGGNSGKLGANRPKGPKDYLTEHADNPFPLRSQEKAHVRHWEQIRSDSLDSLFDQKTFIKSIQEKNPKIAENLRRQFDRSYNSVKDGMTPDDLAGILKEGRGVHIFKGNTKVFDHVQEAQQKFNSIDNMKKSLSTLANNPEANLSFLERRQLHQMHDNFELLQNSYRDIIRRNILSHQVSLQPPAIYAPPSRCDGGSFD